MVLGWLGLIVFSHSWVGSGCCKKSVHLNVIEEFLIVKILYVLMFCNCLVTATLCLGLVWAKDSFVVFGQGWCVFALKPHRFKHFFGFCPLWVCC